MPDRQMIDLLSTLRVGVIGSGPCRIFGDSHAVSMCAPHPGVFEVNYYIMYNFYSLGDQLKNAEVDFSSGKPCLFLSAIDRDIDAGRKAFMESVCAVADSGVNALVATPILVPRPHPFHTNHERVLIFIDKIGGGYDGFKRLTGDVADGIRGDCERQGIPVIDLHRAITDDKSGELVAGLSLGDGWHLNHRAGRILAGLLSDFFQSKKLDGRGDL